MIWRLLRALLFLLDPERVHAMAQRALRLAGRPALVRRRPRPAPSLGVRCLGLDFDGPLGLAAGFDKGEGIAPGLWALGFSHVEVGTITPRPQAGNPRPRLFRLPEHRALLNRMGFNNEGAAACAGRLAAIPAGARPRVLGVNVGKNKDTPNERAAEDYLACIDLLHPFADYLVVNLSSPNTPGLRDLQFGEPLEQLLARLVARRDALAQRHGRRVPLVLKIAPDLAAEDIDRVADSARRARMDALIATNTTVSRQGVEGLPNAAESGGLSGAPLTRQANAVMTRLAQRLAGELPLIGAGGIMTGEDAAGRARAGASLVQLYTGFIYRGPALIGEAAAAIARDRAAAR